MIIINVKNNCFTGVCVCVHNLHVFAYECIVCMCMLCCDMQTRTHLNTYMYRYTQYIHTHANTHTFKHIYMYRYTQYIHTHLNTYTNIGTHNTYTHMQTYTHLNTYTCIRTHNTYTHMQTLTHGGRSLVYFHPSLSFSLQILQVKIDLTTRINLRASKIQTFPPPKLHCSMAL